MSINFSLYLIAITFISQFSIADDSSSPPSIRYPDGITHSTIDEILSNQPEYENFRARLVYTTPRGRSDHVVVLLEEGLFNAIGEDRILQWSNDIVASGYSNEFIELSYCNPLYLRGFLSDMYQTDSNLVGCILVGDLPYALANVYGEPDDVFPCDYFFMELTGFWADNDSDGAYDTWFGNMYPEIFASRIATSKIYRFYDNFGSRDETNEVVKYLSKVHQWRTEGDPYPERALYFCDDDWLYWANQWCNELKILYPTTDLVTNIYDTCDPEYRNRTGESANPIYTWVSSVNHGTVLSYTWDPGGEPASDWVTWLIEVRNNNNSARFYQGGGCSSSDYVSDYNYINGNLIYANSAGLACVGLSGEGHFLCTDYFYTPLASGASLGDAFKSWFNFIMDDNIPYPDWTWDRFLPTMLIGDPTLVPTMHSVNTNS